MAAKKTTTKKPAKSKAPTKKTSLFDPSRKQIRISVFFLIALFFAAVVYINASGVWGYLRNFIFGVFGFTAFILPLFIMAVCIVCAVGKDSKKFKYKVIEGVVLYTLVVAFVFIIKADASLGYADQIKNAFLNYKNYSSGVETDMVYGFGVYGAVFGALPLNFADGDNKKVVAGVVTMFLILILFMLFTGTTVLKIIHSLKAPADAVSEYAGEKMEDIRESYETVATDVHERRAKTAERRRAKAIRNGSDPNRNPVDIPLDENTTPDMGINTIFTEIQKSDISTLKDIKNKQKKNSKTADGKNTQTEKPVEMLASFEESPDIKVRSMDEIFAEMNGNARKSTVKQQVSEPEISKPAVPDITDSVNDDISDITEPADETYDDSIGLNEPQSVTAAADFIDDGESEEPVSEENEPETEAEPETQPETVDLPPVKEYELPPLDCLFPPENNGAQDNSDELRQKAETIVKTLASFGVGTKIVDICKSPSVTRFELQPDPGVKISKITTLADDIAMNLAASGVRIEAPIPNKNAVGIEVPNSTKTTVTMREILDTPEYKALVGKSKLAVALGRDIQGEPTCADLSKMPHLLVAGTTGSGKSVCLNTMIVSILFNAKPDEVKLIMIDPKKVEFTVYRSIPHLLIPVVADPRKAAGALSWAVAEMDKRYALFADNGVRNIQGYNNFAVEQGLAKMPQIVIFIDELSDLMMAASKEVEDSICRLAQKARAAGMHLIVATQRPSVDVITGLIKANIPSRIALAVKSQIDSRTIIDAQGAEKLLGNGDMLFCPVGLSKPVRVQGAYLRDEEIENVIDFIKTQGGADYDDSVIKEIEEKAAQDDKKKTAAVSAESDNKGLDDIVVRAIDFVIESGSASTTFLQRKLGLGYAKAARIIDELADLGYIGPYEGAKPRKVLISKEQWYEMQALSSSNAPRQLSLDEVTADKDNAPADDDTSSVIGNDHNYFGSAAVRDDDGDDD